MKKIWTSILSLSLLIAAPAFAGNEGDKTNASNTIYTASVSGVVTDQLTGEVLPGVAVMVDGMDEKIFTDLDGKFSISNLKAGSCTISLSYISYKEVNGITIELKAGKEGVENIKLEPLSK